MSMWWLALPILLLPVWWHRQKRERIKALPLATARFLPRAEPQQLRVWRWTERLLLLVRCLLLLAAIALLAGVTIPWRGDTVLVVPGTDAAWLERQLADARFTGAGRLATADPFAYLVAHEGEWKAGARLMLAGAVPMPAVQPTLRHHVELRTDAKPLSPSDHRVAIVSKRAAQWRALFAALDGPQRYAVSDTPDARTELVVWDVPEAPPASLHAPLWWVGDASAFPELRNAPSVDGIRYADSPRGRLWTSKDWPVAGADAARALFESWQRLHYAPVAFTAPSLALDPTPSAPLLNDGGAWRDRILALIAALFAIERILAHARRR
ncbi:hypothetical protein Q4S45_22195 [Massilia sp. R2A-15]|uniref:hypothetical protein n=1 Tax=Massilia sp. R2A-15 TaxID=3064278 RepID=UPI002736E1F0|nr:hypothetical protein [Massilia sp. R2A-15]WLI89370.1 hypothetical protein Q4S45_22195 [Massilia sp. R2A-15]